LILAISTGVLFHVLQWPFQMAGPPVFSYHIVHPILYALLVWLVNYPLIYLVLLKKRDSDVFDALEFSTYLYSLILYFFAVVFYLWLGYELIISETAHLPLISFIYWFGLILALYATFFVGLKYLFSWKAKRLKDAN